MKYSVLLKNPPPDLPRTVAVEHESPNITVDDNGWLRVVGDDSVLLLVAAGEWIGVKREDARGGD